MVNILLDGEWEWSHIEMDSDMKPKHYTNLKTQKYRHKGVV